MGRGCPYCSNKRVLIGNNDLATTNPRVAAMWNHLRNSDLHPSDVTDGSNQTVWWVCEKNTSHEWQAPPARLKSGSGCPHCSGRVATNRWTDLATTHPELANEWDVSKNGELTADFVKAGSNKSVWWICKTDKSHSWQAVIGSRALNGRGCPFCSNQLVLAGFNDLGTTHPDLAATWDQGLNGNLRPADVLAGSRKSVWWCCENLPKHSFQMPLFARSSGHGCNVCSGHVVVAGINDLASQSPRLFAEWDADRNRGVRPDEITEYSNKRVWWKCQENPAHVWSAAPNNRKKNGCPGCSGHLLIKGVNDLATLHPSLAKQWSQELNNGKTPDSIGQSSKEKIWWKCPKDATHVWQASLQNRVRKNYGCPICSNLLLKKGYNDLRTLYPTIAEEFDQTKNIGTTASDLLAGSETKVWWRCSTDSRHSWSASVYSRTKQGSGCLICSNNVIIAGVNDLQTTAPQLMETWHPTKNLPLLPSETSAGTHRSVWWRCDSHIDHEWKTSPVNRKRTSCPYCSNKKVLSGFNDLQTLNPELASDWHPTLNGEVKPSGVAPNSNKKFWWVCFNDSSHEWLAVVSGRNRGGGCPRCNNGGFDTTRPGIFYFIQHPIFLASKVGITNLGRNSDRLASWQKTGWYVVKTIEFERGLSALNLETRVLRWIRKEIGLNPYLSAAELSPLGGWSETFATDGIDEKLVLEKIQIESIRAHIQY